MSVDHPAAVHAGAGDGQPGARRALGSSERRRLERDLHDGVQNELIALIIKLAVARQDPDTPPALAETLEGLEARAQAALDAVRDVARGIYPAILADFGVVEALRARALRHEPNASISGTAPRSSDEAEAAVYFACSEALQNVAKHAGHGAHVRVSLRYDRTMLSVRVEDDGQGFDPALASESEGLANIRDRVEAVGGWQQLISSPGRGTVLTISLPWPRRLPRTSGPTTASTATTGDRAAWSLRRWPKLPPSFALRADHRARPGDGRGPTLPVTYAHLLPGGGWS